MLYCRVENEELAQLIVIDGTSVTWQGQPLLKANGPSRFFEWRKQDGAINAEPEQFSTTPLFDELTGNSQRPHQLRRNFFLRGETLMCGIAGILEFGRDTRADAAALREMCRMMAHRGPDDDGFYTDGSVGIGMRRLSIVDLKTGHQPISNEDGSLWIVFNGEIYNHQALREQADCARPLLPHAQRHRNHRPSVRGVRRDCVQHLRGMFAFAIWDRNTKTLFIARDRLGIKPLYYKLTPERLLFGSEIKVLLAHGGIRPEFDRAALPGVSGVRIPVGR